MRRPRVFRSRWRASLAAFVILVLTLPARGFGAAGTGASTATTASAGSAAPAGASAASAASDSGPQVSFAGRVRSGERMERALPGGLRFRLEPQPGARAGTTSGWRIAILGADTLKDYAGIATPPYHGVNDLEIDAWHFRNQSNTGPNDGSVNAPQDLREFRFVTDSTTYRIQDAALEIALWPSDRSQAAQDSAMAVLDSMPVGEGRLEITHMTLGGPGTGVEPYFLDMDFRVDLRWPAKPDARHGR